MILELIVLCNKMSGNKFIDGISREFRYAEYKLRKMRSDKKKDKKKNKQEKSKHFSSAAAASSSDYQFKEYSDAVPSDKTEEALQIQVNIKFDIQFLIVLKFI